MPLLFEMCWLKLIFIEIILLILITVFVMLHHGQSPLQVMYLAGEC